jgi:hypothetical protein
MDNYLPNGAVLPFGLMTSTSDSNIAGFNKTYRNSALRLGIVVKSYDRSDPANLSKLTTEYDVLVFEQVEDRGSTVLTYRNCISAEGMGSIADFFERTLRVKQNAANNSKSVINTSGQNGAVVLILCLDAVTEKAIIIGSVTHPDRQSTLAGQTEHLEGEFNGVNIQVNSDGSANFTFKGPTNNDASPVDASLTPTVVSISSDGSFQVQHSTITMTLAKSGAFTVKATGDVDVTCDNVTITASGNADVKAGGNATIDAPAINLGAGAADAVIKGDTFKKMVFDVHIHPTPIGPSGPPTEPMAPSSLSTVVKTK